jgi:hypothetical protein
MKFNRAWTIIVIASLSLVLFVAVACSQMEGTNSDTTEDPYRALSPDPAFDPLLGCLQQMTTAPIMLPANLPPQLKSVAIGSDTHEDEYTILFLSSDAPNPDQLVQDHVNAWVLGTLSAQSARTPLYDYTRAGMNVVKLHDATLPDGTKADLQRVEPPEGTNGVPFSLGMFEEGGERYTLIIEAIDSPDGDLARQTLSKMAEVPKRQSKTTLGMKTRGYEVIEQVDMTKMKLFADGPIAQRGISGTIMKVQVQDTATVQSAYTDIVNCYQKYDILILAFWKDGKHLENIPYFRTPEAQDAYQDELKHLQQVPNE